MRKSNTLSHHYRPGTSRGKTSLASFRQQMTDYAKGDVLRALRAEKRMSRESVAAEVGVTTKTLFTWEKQNGAIKWENARSLASFYDVEPESLVTRDPDEAAGLPSREQLDRIEDALARLAEHVQPPTDSALGEVLAAITAQLVAQTEVLNEVKDVLLDVKALLGKDTETADRMESLTGTLGGAAAQLDAQLRQVEQSLQSAPRRTAAAKRKSAPKRSPRP